MVGTITLYMKYVLTFVSLFFVASFVLAQTSTPVFTFKQQEYVVSEGSSVRVTVVAPVNLSKTTRVPVRIQSGTAKSGSDFIAPVSTTLTFYKGGLREKTILIRAKADSVREQTESFSIRSTGVVGIATVSITDKSGTVAQTSPQGQQVVCPAPYVAYATNSEGTQFSVRKPTLIKRPYSYIPWGPAAAFGQGAPSFPAYISATYGSQRPLNDPAVVRTTTVEAYEFVGPSKTWQGGDHDVAYYTAPSATIPYELRKGKALISDGVVEIAGSPGGSSCGEGSNYTLTISIDQCPGVIDPRRNYNYNQITERPCTFIGSESGIRWTTPGAQYGINGPNDVPGNRPFFNYSDISCYLETGKTYYLNIATVPTGNQEEDCNVGIRMVNRSSARITP